MYSFASGTIVSAGTSSPSKPGTQPVSSNISLAFSRRVLASLGSASLMIGFLMLVQAVFLIKRHRFRGTGVMEYAAGARGSLRLDAGKLDYLGPFLGFLCDQLSKVGGR